MKKKFLIIIGLTLLILIIGGLWLSRSLNNLNRGEEASYRFRICLKEKYPEIIAKYQAEGLTLGSNVSLGDEDVDRAGIIFQLLDKNGKPLEKRFARVYFKENCFADEVNEFVGKGTWRVEQFLKD